MSDVLARYPIQAMCNNYNLEVHTETPIAMHYVKRVTPLGIAFQQ
jgi:hypothetical protein